MDYFGTTSSVLLPLSTLSFCILLYPVVIPSHLSYCALVHEVSIVTLTSRPLPVLTLHSTVARLRVSWLARMAAFSSTGLEGVREQAGAGAVFIWTLSLRRPVWRWKGEMNTRRKDYIQSVPASIYVIGLLLASRSGITR